MQGPRAGAARRGAGVTCQACGQDRVEAKGEASDGPIFRCAGCGTWRLVPRDQDDPDRDSGYGGAYRRGLDDEKPRRCMRILLEHVPAGGRLLDVGCSEGRFLSLARDAGWHVRGLDPDPGAVQAAREQGIEVLRGSAGDPLPVGGAFDLVTLWDVIEHLPAPGDAAAWLAGVVRDEGRVLVLTPDATSLFDHLVRLERVLPRAGGQRLATLCLNRYHLHRFTPQGLRALFERSGFRVEVLVRTQMFSLRPDRYLSGFAPGIRGWTRFAGLNRALSRALFALVRTAGVRNKLLLVARRTAADVPRPPSR